MQCNIFQVVDVDYVSVNAILEGFCVRQDAENFFRFDVACVAVRCPGWDLWDNVADWAFPWFL